MSVDAAAARGIPIPGRGLARSACPVSGSALFGHARRSRGVHGRLLYWSRSRAGSRREAVLICYLIAGAVGLSAVFVAEANPSEAQIVGLAILFVALYGWWWLEFRRGGVKSS